MRKGRHGVVFYSFIWQIKANQLLTVTLTLKFPLWLDLSVNCDVCTVLSLHPKYHDGRHNPGLDGQLFGFYTETMPIFQCITSYFKYSIFLRMSSAVIFKLGWDSMLAFRLIHFFSYDNINLFSLVAHFSHFQYR